MPRYLNVSYIFTCFIYYLNETAEKDKNEIIQLQKMQKLSQKRAIEIKKIAQQTVNQREPSPEPAPKPVIQVDLFIV
jgi:hypothetical protein